MLPLCYENQKDIEAFHSTFNNTFQTGNQFSGHMHKSQTQFRRIKSAVCLLEFRCKNAVKVTLFTKNPKSAYGLVQMVRKLSKGLLSTSFLKKKNRLTLKIYFTELQLTNYLHAENGFKKSGYFEVYLYL